MVSASLKSYGFNGKTIVPFRTSSSNGGAGKQPGTGHDRLVRQQAAIGKEAVESGQPEVKLSE